jgi:PAS domain S-box-containing protein
LSSLTTPIRAPDLAELETLVACAGAGSLAAAAQGLEISRPAVAKRIKNLEALAGKPLLHRGGRGVRLTDAGATLLAGARRILDERDVILSLLREIRGDGPSPIAGLRELLGHSPEASRAAQQPEARLAETESVLALVLRASATGVVISNPETRLIYEVNDSFCRFTGRSRAELLGDRTEENTTWFDLADRERVVEEVRRTGVVERSLIRTLRPDGTMRVGQAASRFVALAGTRQLLWTIDDVTEQHVLEVERTAGIGSYRAVTQVSKLLKAGNPTIDSIASILPDIRRTGGLTTALL